MVKNYCLIKEQYDNLMLNALENKDKPQISKLKSALAENKQFQKLYVLVENLQSGEVRPDRCAKFVDDNIKMAQDVDLSSFNVMVEAFKGQTTEENPVLEHINRVLFEKKTVNNIQSWEKSYNIVCEHLKSINKKEEVSFEQKMEKLVPLFEQLDDDDKSLITEFVKVGEDDREQVYNELVGECVSILNEQLKKISKDDLTTKVSLLETKDKIRESKYEQDTYIQKVIMLHTLKKDILS